MKETQSHPVLVNDGGATLFVKSNDNQYVVTAGDWSLYKAAALVKEKILIHL